MAAKLLNSIFSSVPLEALDPFLPTVFQLLLRRLVDNKTPRFCKIVMHSFSVFVLVYGAPRLFDRLEKVQPGLLGQLITQVWLPHADFIAASDTLEVNQMIVGGTKLLCETGIANEPTSFTTLMKVLLKLVGQHGAADSATDALLESLLEDEVTENREFDSKYSKLAFSQIPEPVSSQEVKQAHSFFAVMLANLCRTRPGQYLGLMKAALDKRDGDILADAMAKSGQSLI